MLVADPAGLLIAKLFKIRDRTGSSRESDKDALDIFRLLVRAGRDGIPAGGIASALKLAPNTLTFHLDRLREADLVTVQREGRSMIYAARYETMNGLLAFLTENCCQGNPEQCRPAGRANR